MASIQQGAPAVKPTFAKVAASGYKPSNSNKQQNSLPNTQSKLAAAEPSPQPSVSENKPVEDKRNGVTKVDSSGVGNNYTAVGANDRSNPREATKTSTPVSHIKREEQNSHDGNSGPISTSTDDGNTQLSSSNSSAKQGPLDSKSVVSVATFGMDEKESLRPEDSASLKATEEEDRLSAQGSGAAGSRVGSDSGARAFRDQLREISNVAAPTPRGATTNRFAPTMILNSAAAYDEAVIQNSAQLSSLTQPMPVMMPSAVPDDRLIEALASGRDRVWVLKLEQDIIDFVKDSSENELTLPQCNSFYRMLAHKLADYYMLDHTVDATITGAAVVIRRTPFFPPLPPPLSGLPSASSVASTPPPNVPARKIMRRGNDGNQSSFPSTTANSEGPSKATSEAGGESNSDGGAAANDAQGKTTMTREEREAKYQEARLRIFGTLDKGDGNDLETKVEEANESRASSSSEKKKSKKRSDSDDFEPRSVFPGPPFYPPQGYESGGMGYYSQLPMVQGSQYPIMPQHGPVAYPNGFQQMVQPDPQVQYQYPGSPYAMYTHPANPEYDLAASFQRGMQSFQNASPSPQMQMRSPMAQSTFPQGQFQAPATQYNQQWAPMPYSQQYPQAMYMAQPYSDHPMAGAGQMPPNGQYSYQPPNPASPFQNGQQKIQPPMQQSFVGRQFNPQSQAFVPGHRIPPMPHSQPSQMQSMAAMQPIQMVHTPRMHNQSMHVPASGPQPMPSVSRQTSSSYNSPRLPNPPASLPQNPNASSTPNNSAALPATTQPPLSHPLPTPPNPTSSIAKWGTPAHLPAKPPPPATLEPLKYNELTRAYQGLPGMPFVGPNGVSTINGSGGGPGAGYSGGVNGAAPADRPPAK